MKSISRYLMALLAIAFFQQNIHAQTGNVGVNQDNPASVLDVNGNLSIGSTYSGTSTAPANGAIIEGKVGIGLTIPSVPLEVFNPALNSTIGKFTSSGVWGEMHIGTVNELISLGANDAFDYGYIGTSNPIDFYIRTNNTPRLIIDGPTGNVGIGTISPATLLHLSKPGEVELSLESTSPYGRSWTLQSNPTSPSIKTHFQIIDRTAGASRLAIDSLGKVGIGTVTPANRLDVEGGLAIGATYSGTSTAPANGAIIQGNVGIGTTSPANRLDVEGGVAVGSTYSGTSAAPANGVIIEGAVGIGTSNVPAKLSVSGPAASPSIPGANSTGLLRLEGSNYGSIDIGKYLSSGNYAGWIQVGYAGTTVDPLAIQPLGGYVGIGTSAPIAPLHVSGVSGNNGSTNIKYFNHSTNNIASGTNWQGQTAILANGNICATEAFISGASFNFSDARIKHIIGRSDGVEDIDRLNQIEITRYTHIDTISRGSAVQTKVIAQQLEQVMPEAVSYTREFIPDVMQVVENIDFQVNMLTATLPKPHSLQVGDHVKCIDEKGQELFVDVLAAPNENSLVFKTEQRPSQLFIYGKQVDDFHIVDYDAIAMLNVSATQELAKRLEASEQSVMHLQTEVAALKSQLSEMEALKRQVAQLASALQSPAFTTQIAKSK